MNGVISAKTAHFWNWLTGYPLNKLRQTYVTVTAAYAFCFLPWFSTYRTAETLLVVLFLGIICFADHSAPVRKALVRDPIFKLCLIFLVFLLVAQLWYAYSLPDYIEISSKTTRHFLKPLMVLLVALGIIMLGNKGPWLLLITAGTGFVSYLALNFHPLEWTAALAGERVNFGIHNAQHTGMFFGTALLALISFAPRAWRTSRKNRAKLAIRALYIAGLLLASFGTIAAQTRAVWLGLSFAAFLTVIFGLPYYFSKQKSAKKRLHKIGGVLFFVSAALLLNNFLFNAENTVEERLDKEHIDIQKLYDLPKQHADPTSSSGVRLTTWRVAMEWLIDRPVMGWGGGSSDDLIDHSSYFSKAFKERFGHLHNSYLEAVVANGLFGGMILASILVWLLLSSARAFQMGYMPTDVFIFTLCFMAFWLTINMFESYILFPTGQYLFAIVGGFFYSFYFRNQLELRRHE